jgi:hypothetical protein
MAYVRECDKDEMADFLPMFVETLVKELVDEFHTSDRNGADKKHPDWRSFRNIYIDRRIRSIAEQLVEATCDKDTLERRIDHHTHPTRVGIGYGGYGEDAGYEVEMDEPQV